MAVSIFGKKSRSDDVMDYVGVGVGVLTAAEGAGDQDGAGGRGAVSVPGSQVEVVGRPARQAPHHHAVPRGVPWRLHPLPSAAPVVKGVT